MGNTARPLRIPDLEAYRSISPLHPSKMRSQIYRSVSKATKALFSVLEGRTVAAAVTTLRGKVPRLSSFEGRLQESFWGLGFWGPCSSYSRVHAPRVGGNCCRAGAYFYCN
ncbi:hypothetical protein CKAN_00950700 [Cinnamomum micranthum f. kanehirae]|uniref:Uncharacterized protein n=1 Tax=Cinnamomum micranthum f. kanehirae TaxID=337451 RepID=A0A443NQQ9_9MAGN|nr:hypothetical protein CKAN_00950700 [Cinnamomum micranthum f. kanehirae]